MNYEQKYKEALERAMNIRFGNPSSVTANVVCEDIFPELKEYEDKRIRKALIQHLRELRKSNVNLMTKDTYDCWIDWLVRKGENHTVDNNEIVKSADKIQIGKKYKCVASPRYSTFMKGKIYKPEDKFVCSLMNLCSVCFEPIEDDVEL